MRENEKGPALPPASERAGPMTTPGEGAAPHQAFARGTNAATGGPILDAALNYASRGRPVLPLHTATAQGRCTCKRPDCGSAGKHPRTAHGLKEATTDEDQIRVWWRDHPDANLGLLTGEASGFIVLDVDPRHGGDKALQELEIEHGALPPTVIALTGLDPATGKRGQHILFRHPGRPIKNKAALAPGLDIRGDGGYIVAAPSRHASGVTYEWDRNHHPDKTRLAEAPAWLLKIITGTPSQRTGGPEAMEGQAIIEGGRNAALTSIAGSMRRKGLAPEAIEAALLVENRNRCKPPLPESEVRAIAASVGRYKPTAPLVGATDTGHPTLLPYIVHNGEICHVKQTRDGPVFEVLARFNAWIVEELIHDDGAEEKRFLIIEGARSDGRPFTRTEVPTKDFINMGWPLVAWGASAVVAAGSGKKDQCREAIQLLSGEPPKRRVFKHCGWRKEDSRWLYLHAGGAIGADGPVEGIEVELEERLARIRLPNPHPPRSLAIQAAVREALTALDVAPDEVTAALLGGVHRAVLAEAASIDMAIHLVGPSGTMKSELTALFQAFYGPGFTRETLPAAWSATANFLERTAFLTKDAVLGVDDFAPTGSQTAVSQLHAQADRFIRAIGNGAGRGRLTADAGHRPTYAPRGFVISSGEDTPRGQSCRARLLVLEISRETVNRDRFTHARAQADAGTFAAATAAYIQWVASHMEELRQTLRGRIADLRSKLDLGSSHLRTPTAIASLGAAWEQYLRFATETGAISADDRSALWDRVWSALRMLGAAQSTHQDSENPAYRVIELLGSALRSGRAHLAAPDGDKPPNAERWGWRKKIIAMGHDAREEWTPMGGRIGWIPSDEANRGTVYLDQNAAFGVAQAMAREQGDSISVGAKVLSKRLWEYGFLASKDDTRSRYVVRRMLAGVRYEVLHVKMDHLVKTPSRALLGSAASYEDAADEDDVQTLLDIVESRTGRRGAAPIYRADLIEAAEKEGVRMERITPLLERLKAEGRLVEEPERHYRVPQERVEA